MKESQTFVLGYQVEFFMGILKEEKEKENQTTNTHITHTILLTLIILIILSPFSIEADISNTLGLVRLNAYLFPNIT